MRIHPDIVGKIIEKNLMESKECIHVTQRSIAFFFKHVAEEKDFWQHTGGMKLAGAFFQPDLEAIYVLFLSGNAYLLPIASLKNVRTENVCEVKLDEFDDGVVVRRMDGTTTDFASDFVLYNCEPRYRQTIDAVRRPMIESIAKRIGRRVRQMREQRGLSLRSFAKKSKLAVPNASNLEAGKHEPKLETLQRISKVLGVSIADLVSV